MLSLLHIENIAVIEKVDVRFGAGLNVLTGETGAGKSIIIDSINAVLGDRVSRDLLRTGAKKAVVSAEFTDPPELPGAAAGEKLTLAREISADGRGSCRVNGKPVPAQTLRDIGSRLVDIHGQHDSLHLLNPDTHLDYLDGFARDGELAAQYAAAYRALRETEKSLRSLELDEGEKARRMEMLSYQINEIESASLHDGEEEELTKRRDILRNAGKLVETVNAAHAALSGGDDFDGAVDLLARAASDMSAAAAISDDYAAVSGRLESLRYEAEDVADELRSLADDLPDGSDNEINEVESRLDAIYRLKRKYGGSVGEILAFLDDARVKLDDIRFSDERREKLAAMREKQYKTALSAAEKLSEARKAAALELSERVESELKYLDMGRVRFSAEFDFAEEPPKLTERGIDSVEFFIAPNVGESMKPLSKTASGGELSRIMLAFKNVLASMDGVPTLIFDEIDAGISGRAAQRVGEKLWSVSSGGKKQVLCVTHLSQIAAMGDEHFLIEKQERGGRTSTDVRKLDREGREREIARINTGDAVTEASIAAAKSQLDIADSYKRKSF